MPEDGRLVHSLIKGIVARLPDVTGVDAPVLYDDDAVSSARATLVEVSQHAIGAVLKRLVSLLDEFYKREQSLGFRSDHTRQSESFVIELLADCCRAHWKSVRDAATGARENGAESAMASQEESSGGSSTATSSKVEARGGRKPRKPKRPGNDTTSQRSSKSGAHSIVPPSLAESQVVWFLEVLTRLTTLIPEDYHLPSSALLRTRPDTVPSFTERLGNDSTLFDGFYKREKGIDCAVSEIVEYLSACNWPSVLSYIQGKLRILRELATSTSGNSSGSPGHSELETNALKGLGAIAHLWMDGRKLSIVLQELCVYFLNLSKTSQNAIAILLPQAIIRWLDNNPAEFVHMHRTQKRLDGNADILFDMCNSTLDEIHRRAFLWPFQTALILLIPDVFHAAGTIGNAKSGTISKKVTFLEGLRKGLGSPRAYDTAIFCLVGVCRIARHFPIDSESALLSYALDVQNEIRLEVFNQALSVPPPQDRPLDIHLLIAAFVSLSYLDLDSIVESVVPKCFEQTSPIEFRLAVFGSCNIISQQSDADQYSQLFTAVAPHIWDFFKSLRTEQSSLADDMFPGDLSPRDHPDTVPVRLLLHFVLEFLARHPRTLLHADTTLANDYYGHLEEELEELVIFLGDKDEKIRMHATSIAHSLTAAQSLIRSPQDPHRPSFDSILQFWRSTSLFLSSISTKIIDHSMHELGIKTMIEVINDVFATRLGVLRKDGAVQKCLDAAGEIHERGSASEDLEVAYLVLLCSSSLEICAAVTSSLALFCEEGSMTENSTDLIHSCLTIMRNYDAYAELCSSKFRLTGMVAFQKRFRKCLMHMSRPSRGILTAWEIIFSQWFEINKEILTPRSQGDSNITEKSFLEWRNFSGFLASVGGCCISDTSQIARVDEGIIAGLRWIDRLSPNGNDQSLLSQYLSQSLELLFCGALRVREATREVLGVELSAKLFPYLLHSLESGLLALFKGSAKEPTPQTAAIVLEQAASLLKAMVEHLSDMREPFFSAEFETMSFELARYTDGLQNDTAMLRVKIKVCQLCEAVSCRRATVSLGHAVRIRNQLVSIMFSWLSWASHSHKDPSVSNITQRTDEVVRYQRDLNRACLRALVNLTYRLPLQVSTEQNDADSFEPKTQLFFDYFKCLVSQLEDETAQLDRRHDHSPGTYRLEETSSGLDLTISALSNLLSANIDVGLKHALDMGYHQNIQVRTAFLQVLCNILSQEAEFERLSNTAIMEKYNLLLEAITRDMGFVVALCNSCSSGEVDELAIALLNIFESRGMSFPLLKALIEHEVAITPNETELLRRHCVTTKMLSAYARWKGAAYLRSTMQQIIARLIQSSKELDLELDPTRSTSPEELHRNALQLQRITQIFIEDICKSAENVPATFRRICHTIASAVTPRFPEAKFTAVGAFIFLRFFCPAIVAPDSEGLVSSVPTKEMRRGLVLIAKVVQNLANNILFGAKEQYMSPMNDFLAQNIYRVTAYLREISSHAPVIEDDSLPESFDFGSCVVLHRCLFDHWDDVRQKILARERRSWQGSSTTSDSDGPSTQQTTPLNQLVELIPSLGPPQLDISWNSPQISANTPHAYARFQEFMFRSIRRNAETIASSRAIYDGGQSRDGIPVICIILRTIEQEGIDFDLLLFTFLKIASRMWHRPFGVLIDVTCYRGLTTFPDEIIRKVNSLSPAEIARNFGRFYIYNMNSVYRKCSRRLLRLVAKEAHNIFNPTTLDYHLIGTLQELQAHFHLGSLQLPKDTISVVTDSRFIFQPVMRLSRTKGKLEVVIMVGSQYVQITTCQKQDIGPGFRLSGTVNDIFRVADLEEAKIAAPMDEETTFGFRTENGKIAMYFFSSRKSEIVQAIRSAKAKNRKELKSAKSLDRLIKPDDIPGSLLNVSLMNLASTDRALRLASYNTIAGLSKAFHFDIDKELITAKELDIPAESTTLVKGISKSLAVSEPSLTHDFLSEFFIGWERLSIAERPRSVVYMSPWLANLGKHVMASENDSERGRETAAAIARKLIETAIRAPINSACFQEHAWLVIAKDDALVEIFLDEMVKVALEHGPGTEQAIAVASIAASIGTLTIRGKIIARLRKVLNRSSLRPTRSLIDNAIWDEIVVLLRMCLEVSFNNRGQSQLFLPELFHIITMTVHCGSSITSACVHSLLINTVHSLCATFPLTEARLTKLKTVLISLTEPKVELLFDLRRVAGRDTSPLYGSKSPDAAMFSHLEAITILLQTIVELGAPSNTLASSWRSRWMSLVASTAFQSNPAIQPKAFIVMGCLASENVDDDLLYQVLVSLRSGISRFTEDGDSELMISIVTTLTKMVVNLSPSSRYIKNLFWLAVSLLRLVPLAIFNCTASLLEAVVQVLAAPGASSGPQIESALLQGRASIEQVLSEVDERFGVRFAPNNFHVALSICLLKGLTESVTQPSAMRVLSTFLELNSMSVSEQSSASTGRNLLPYVLLLATHATTVDERRDIFWLAGNTSSGQPVSPAEILATINIEDISDSNLLCNLMLIIANFTSCGPVIQQQGLRYLLRFAAERPSVFLLLIDPLTSILHEILISSRNAATTEAAHALTRVIARMSGYVISSKPAKTVNEVLSEAGLEGIWKASSFDMAQDQQIDLGVLIDKLIELIII